MRWKILRSSIVKIVNIKLIWVNDHERLVHIYGYFRISTATRVTFGINAFIDSNLS